MRIAVIGGGPAGLYFARLVGKNAPEHEIVVFEQNPPEATFGFGVGLGGNARDRLRAADPELHDKISAGMVFTGGQNIHLNGTDILLEYAQTGGAIERLALLRILRAACRDVGVSVIDERRVERPEDVADYDLVVGADGVNSIVRNWYGDAFGTKLYHLTNHFAWYGVAHAMRPSALVFRETERGRFVAHYYAYTGSMSTFVAECDDETWHRGGLADMTDAARRVFFEELFADELQGAKLVENRSIWRQFPVITNTNWHVGKTVLIGDALLSAHFSIGSGTRLAMDDAASLYEAIAETDDVAVALVRFEELRRPMRERFRQAAEKSFTWYENLAGVMRQRPIDFVYDFLTRTGRLDDDRLAEYCPGFYAMYREETAKRVLAAS